MCLFAQLVSLGFSSLFLEYIEYGGSVCFIQHFLCARAFDSFYFLIRIYLFYFRLLFFVYRCQIAFDLKDSNAISPWYHVRYIDFLSFGSFCVYFSFTLHSLRWNRFQIAIKMALTRQFRNNQFLEIILRYHFENKSMRWNDLSLAILARASTPQNSNLKLWW